MPRKKKNLGSTQKQVYKATFSIFGKIYTAEGKTALEAIQNLNPDIHRGVGILTVEKGDIRREKIIGGPLVRRLFGPGGDLGKQIALKQISTLFDF